MTPSSHAIDVVPDIPIHEFLNAVLPEQGYGILALPAGKGYRHQFFEDRALMAATALKLDRQGKTVYYALAGFKTKDNRKAENAGWAKAFWLDIDVKPGAPGAYQSQTEALQAVMKFYKALKLPSPTLVSSGRGIHVYWPLTDAVPIADWRPTAALLKECCNALGLHADPTRTADAASVLRPPQTTNRKQGQELPVRCLRLSTPAPLSVIDAAVRSAASSVAAVPRFPVNRAVLAVNEAVGNVHTDTPSSAHAIAEHCGQIRSMRDTRGDLSEPLWYGAIGVLRHTQEGDGLIHEWSCGHPQYDAAETQRKIDQHRDSGVGPTTCAHFRANNPNGCVGCSQAGNITSPIQLGRRPTRAQQALPAGAPDEEVPSPPWPYQFTKQGGVAVEVDDAVEVLYEHPLYLSARHRDEADGVEYLMVRSWLPRDGWIEFELGGGLLSKHRDLMSFLGEQGIHIPAAAHKETADYLVRYAQDLQKRKDAKTLFARGGWRGTDVFVCGPRAYHADGTVKEGGVSTRSSQALNGFRSQGDLEQWKQAIQMLDRPGLEAQAFVFLCGFAAPLMHLTGYNGALVSVVGSSGIGKSAGQDAAMSVYGNYQDLKGTGDGSVVALIKRLGVFGALPVCMDELTNIDPRKLSDLVYAITQGKEKPRLNRNGSERRNDAVWSTIAIASSNESLVAKLAAAKSDAEAGYMRCFEVYVEDSPAWPKRDAETFARLIHANYGLAADPYLSYLVRHRQDVQEELYRVQARFDNAAEMEKRERFWGALMACVFTGTAVAQRLGLIQFDVERIVRWAVRKVTDMREQVRDNTLSPVELLMQFVAEHTATNRLLLADTKFRPNPHGGWIPVVPLESPRGDLVIREELDTGRMYIVGAVMRRWLHERCADVNRVKAALEADGVLLNARMRKQLGAGTTLNVGQIWCWEINTRHPVFMQPPA